MGRHRQPHHLDGHAHRHATGEDDTKTVPVRGPTTPSSRPCPRPHRPLVSYRKVVGTGNEVQRQRDQVLDLAHRSERLEGDLPNDIATSGSGSTEITGVTAGHPESFNVQAAGQRTIKVVAAR